MNLSPNDLLKVMSDKTNEELYDILHVHSQNYTHTAVDAAREVFDKRHLPLSRVSGIAVDVERARALGEAHLSWPLRILAFFVSTIALGIPGLLAHRRFVEKGEKRKASEWARWAFSGFIFYCVLGVLIRAFAR